MKLRVWIAIVCVALFGVTSWAQETSTLITVDNADQLQLISSVGGALPKQLVWSPDNETLAIQTTQDVTLYHVDDGSSTLIPIAQSQSVSFDEQGNLKINDQLWDATTGELIGVVEAPIPSTNFPTESAELPVETYLTVREKVYSPDKRYLAIYGTDNRDEFENPYLQLWDVRSKTMVMEEIIYIDIIYLFEFHGDGKLLLLHFNANENEMSDELSIYDTQTGELLTRDIVDSLDFSHDGRYFVYEGLGGISLWSDKFISLPDEIFNGLSNLKALF